MRTGIPLALFFCLIFTISLILILVLYLRKPTSIDLTDPDTFNKECDVELVRNNKSLLKRCEKFCRGHIPDENNVGEYTFCATLPGYQMESSPCLTDWLSVECQSNVRDFCLVNRELCRTKCLNSRTCSVSYCSEVSESLVCSDASISLTNFYANADHILLKSLDKFLAPDIPEKPSFAHLVSSHESEIVLTNMSFEWVVLVSRMRVALVPRIFPSHSLHKDGIVRAEFAYDWLIIRLDDQLYIRTYDSDTTWLGPGGIQDHEYSWDINAVGRSLPGRHFVDFVSEDFMLKTGNMYLNSNDGLLELGSTTLNPIKIDSDSVSEIIDSIWVWYTAYLREDGGGLLGLESGEAYKDIYALPSNDNFILLYQDFWRGEIILIDSDLKNVVGMYDDNVAWVPLNTSSIGFK